jgi:cation transport ATPase
MPISLNIKKKLRKNKGVINLVVSITLSLLLEVQMLHHLNLVNLSGTIFLNGIFQLILCIIVLFFAGRGFVYSFVNRIRNKTIGMDALVVIGGFSAFAFSIFQ